MKSSLRWFALAVCSSLIVGGCKKNETADTEAAPGGAAPASSADAATGVSPGGPGTEAPASPGSPSVPGAPAITASAAPAPADQAAYEAWFKKHNLNLSDPKMLDEDPDGDGFTNREEFLADSDPHDKNSRPGIHKSIRLKEYREVRLPFELDGIDGDKARLKRTDEPNAKPITVKEGDTIKGLPYKVVRVEAKQDYDKAGVMTDFTQVAFEDTGTKEKVVLMKNLPARTAATSAVLVSPDGKTTMTVHRGDVFSWPEEQASRYKVIDLSPDQVVLLQLDTNKTWTIPKE
jgi:hypothetical protein